MISNGIKILSIIIIVVAFSTPFLSAQNYQNQLIPYEYKGLWGYMNKEKKVIINPTYEIAGLFNLLLGKNSYPYAIVGNNSKFGVINQSGNLIIPMKFDSIANYSILTNKGRFGILYKKNKKSYFSSKGKISTKLKGKRQFFCIVGLGSHCLNVSHIEKFENSDSRTEDYYKLIVLNKKGNSKENENLNSEVNIKIDSVLHFSLNEGMILFRSDGKIAICKTIMKKNKFYNISTGFAFDDIQLYKCKNALTKQSYEHVIKTKKNGLWGLTDFSYIDYSNELSVSIVQEIVKPMYLRIYDKEDDLYLVEYEIDKLGYIQRKKFGKLVEFW